MYCLKEAQFNAVHISSECIIEGEIIPKYEVDEVAANKDLVIDLEDDFISEVAKFVERYDLRSLNIKEVFIELSSKEFNKVSRVDSFIKVYKKHTNKPMNFINVYLSEVPDMEIVDTVITENIELLYKEGVQVYLNDYGTGYSTLNVISRFKFDGMKISSRIVHNAETRIDSHVMLTYLLNVAKDLNIQVVIPGIEDENDFAVNKLYNVKYETGLYFSEFIDETKFIEFIKRNIKV